MKEEMMMDDMMKPAVEETAVAAPAAAAPAAAAEPKYMGRFSKVSHDVEGDIFLLDDKTIYIQGFSFDGNAPDVHFWSLR